MLKRLFRIGGSANDDKLSEAAKFWDAQHAAEANLYWTAYPAVRAYVNECVTGVTWLPPLVALKAGWTYNPLPRGLSIGCGTGGLERAVRTLRICERVDGVDVSPQSIAAAKKLAKAQKETGIHYNVADCDTIKLPPNRYDIAFFHASLHHISDPDRILSEVNKSLKPHGLLYIEDYIGPSRDEWSDEHLVVARAAFSDIDDRFKLWAVNPPFDYTDPSEMIRSSRIKGAVESLFDIIHYKPYWGNVLFPVLCAVRSSDLLTGDNVRVVDRLIDIEKEAVASGSIRDPFFAVFLARKRLG